MALLHGIVVDLIFLLACCCTSLYGSSVSNIEQNLMTNLLTNYSVNARPTLSNRESVIVKFDVKIGKLVKLDIKEQVMIANTRIMMEWTDPSLVWNKKKYNNTGTLTIPNNLVWTPDIMLYNTAVMESKGKDDLYKSHVIVRNTGKVVWMSPLTLQASCSIYLKWFPFDEQVCRLNFGSISYTERQLQLKRFKTRNSFDEIQAKFYFSSGHWKIVSIDSNITTEYYECCFDGFSIIHYTFTWKRLSLYWLLYLVLPCLCLAVLAVFTFFIPAATGERSGFAITTVLAMSVYLLVISDKMPEKSDESPVIGVLYIVLFFIMTAVLLSVIITTYMAYKTTKPPKFLRKHFVKKNKKPPKDDVTSLREPPGVRIPMKRVAAADNEVEPRVETEGDDLFNDLPNARFRSIGKKQSLRRHLSVLSAQEEKELENQEEWQIIAAHVDRILFWIFCVMIFIGPGIVLLSYI
eukprot:gene9290-10271_t